MEKLKNKVAVITGATSGMALATAQLFVEEGAYVFITGRRQEALDEAVELIGRNVTGVRGDAADLDDLDRLFDTVKREKARSTSCSRALAPGGGRQTGRDYRAALRCRLRPESARHAVYDSEGVAAVQRWRIDLHDRVNCFGERFSAWRVLSRSFTTTQRSPSGTPGHLAYSGRPTPAVRRSRIRCP